MTKSFIVLMTLIFVSCGKDDNQGPTPIITGFSPSSGVIGNSVAIITNNFIPPVTSPANWLTKPTVKFNGIIAESELIGQDSLDEQVIYSTVPAGATSGRITVTVNEKTAMSQKDFIVTVPNYLPNVTVSTVSSYGGIDITVDIDGNLYVADNQSFEIFKIALDGTRTVLLSTVSNINRGTPMGITLDNNGNVYAVVGNTIRKILPDGSVKILAGSANDDFGDADGQGAEARFGLPWGITVDTSGIIYVADFSNFRIRKISPDGMVSTLAGSIRGYADGQGTNAKFERPIDVEIDTDGNILVSDGNKIRKITPDGNVTTWAGSDSGHFDGLGTSAQFNSLFGITVDPIGNVYVCDAVVVRRITIDGTVTTVAGSTFGTTDGPGASAQFPVILGITSDASGTLYLTQKDGGRPGIRKIVIN